uniref:U12-theraphotoxin-Hs1a n=1 Tax=Cyriopagopus schmidti TaxID=29017 RepID=TX10A_CYRSC|nr:RecName: Full=U12-theraphotoxin-Hs1a; Short=U12-TRTX-Hs1a; AltName: Full=Huwentoxin-10a; AltName: Full=Huwentoxin-Xa; Short=HwTx-Xa; Flags: Precursor [Cyriopagopus schmidti]ABY77739.1 HWTX-Xa precursor [Cyriopagopus schmidti]
MNVKILLLLVGLNLVMHSNATGDSETNPAETLFIEEIFRRGCFKEGKWCPKSAPCCAPLKCKGPSIKQQKCVRE